MTKMKQPSTWQWLWASLVDLKGDISGYLSSHPQSPLMSLHHFDQIEPIFPSLDRFQSANHLMKTARVDQSRMLQQTICYHQKTDWSFSISWGYSAHIYENIIPRTMLKRPLETFEPWVNRKEPPHYLFNTRWPPFSDDCNAPHVFFFDSIDTSKTDQIVTTYVRSKPRGLETCSSSGNHSADHISKVRVFSPATKLLRVEKSECCDIVDTGRRGIAEIKYRDCKHDEIIA
ncbi:unnamed protein product [Thlaspi arvense]|uniref:Uncharacterized protein n=1 Tax=Thlaspi arvense TaxID=13288 RepID=A0AAU9RLZ2_THLAR|nr:unnamed protein product [Thlaspi arvense]